MFYYIFIIILFLFGCYKENLSLKSSRAQEYQALSLIVLPISIDDIDVKSPTLVRRAYRRDKREPKRVIQDSVYALLNECLPLALPDQKILKHSIGALGIDEIPDSLYIYKGVEMGEDSMLVPFFIPKSEFLIEHDIGNAQLALFINNLEVRTDTVKVETYLSTFKPSLVNESDLWAEQFEVTIRYILWDYTLNDVVTTGIVHAEDTDKDLPTSKKFEGCLKAAFVEIFNETPLLQRPIRNSDW